LHQCTHNVTIATIHPQLTGALAAGILPAVCSQELYSLTDMRKTSEGAKALSQNTGLSTRESSGGKKLGSATSSTTYGPMCMIAISQMRSRESVMTS